MAYITKHGEKWRAQVEKNGVRRSKVCATKAEAREWAARMELRASGDESDITVEDAIEHYLTTKPNKWNRLRLMAFARSIGVRELQEITTPVVTRWRDTRLTHVAESTVSREATMIRSFFKAAVQEYKWITANPFDGVKFTDSTAPRHQRWGWRDIRKVCRSLGYVTNQPPTTKSQEAAYAFLIALRTAMRAQEVLSAELHGNVAHLYKTKTTRQGQLIKVPLTRNGVRLLRKAGKFTLKTTSLDALFRKAMRRQMVKDLTFHDTRATALTHLAKKVPIQVLARISRHADVSMLVNTYYRETAEEIAAQLN